MGLVWIYTYLSGDNDYDYVSEHLDVMVEERRNFHDAKNLRSNLLEVHCNMQAQVKDKLTNALAPLLQIPVPKTHTTIGFAIFLEPRYVMELKDIKTFHQIKMWTPKYLSRR